VLAVATPMSISTREATATSRNGDLVAERRLPERPPRSRTSRVRAKANSRGLHSVLPDDYRLRSVPESRGYLIEIPVSRFPRARYDCAGKRGDWLSLGLPDARDQAECCRSGIGHRVGDRGLAGARQHDLELRCGTTIVPDQHEPYCHRRTASGIDLGAEAVTFSIVRSKVCQIVGHRSCCWNRSVQLPLKARRIERGVTWVSGVSGDVA